MPNKIITTPSGLQICFVDREQLRVKTAAKRFAIPRHLKDILAAIPSTPTTFEWSVSERIVYDVLGNDYYGDCWYAAACHGAQTWLGNNGNFLRFDPNAVVARYTQLSGGDNGLDDATLLSEWLTGIVGPNGPHKILARATIDPADVASVTAGFYFFGGGSYTGSLPNEWITNPHPGQIWTNSGPPNPRNGHAVHISGRNAAGNWVMRTWGLTPAIQMTQAGLVGSDSEIIIEVSLDWFNAQGYAPNGYHYTQLASIWTAMTGGTLPASPFPPPVTPVPVPVPPDPKPVPPPVPPAPPLPPTPTPAPAPSFVEVFNRIYTIIEQDSGNPFFMRRRLEGAIKSGIQPLWPKQ